ncbi:unnamed protein product [Darwinula stevensoni]|uniref:Uncharacterized protein n=1 Tax=Darwinula stevensoni TaxID=69355 RepID=A0A7R8XDY9_9CRUS|nr:unnamed protein product [Darwinula stevensoni]CAG0893750.1 unnamed protein product [Darwinula stevensoni]
MELGWQSPRGSETPPSPDSTVVDAEPAKNKQKIYGHDNEDLFDYSASSLTPMHAGDDGNLHDPLVECTCQFGERLNNIAIPSTCRQEIIFDICEHIQVNFYLKACTFVDAGARKLDVTNALKVVIENGLQPVFLLFTNVGRIRKGSPKEESFLLELPLLAQGVKERDNPVGEDVELPRDREAVAAVFTRIKDICGSHPSFLVADYKFSETFNRGGTLQRALYTKRLVDERSWLLLIAGGPGTGKTIVVKERAKQLGTNDPNAEVLVVNLPGGLLTKDYRDTIQKTCTDQGLKNITILDGKEEGILEDRQELFAFLRREGKGKHVLLDEVPLTLGIQGRLDEMRLSEHWMEVSTLKGHVSSLTFSFRPNDVAYTRDIRLQDIKIADADIKILNVVKRNTRHVTDLFLALGNYVRRIFVCQEPTIRETGCEIDYFLLPKTTLTVIFGPPSSGKSKQLLERINQLVHIARQGHNEYGILLLHMGSALCQKETLDRLGSNPINMLDIERVKSLSPVEIVKYGGVARVQWKCHCSIIHIYVDDYCIEAVDAEKEIEEWTRALEELTRATLTLTLTVVFQTHSRGGREISMEKLISFFQDRHDSEVIKLHEPGTAPDCCTSKQLLHHIYNNETCNPLKMVAKTLPTGSRPGAWVIGSKPKRISIKYLCPGNHLDLSCKGQESCLPYIGAYVCFLSALSQEILGEVVYVLMPDRKLMNFLQTISGEHARRLHFFHPEDFRGCESSVTITVNVDDSWILESLSRAKTHLYIIDCLPEHQQVWRTMLEEGRIQEEVLTHNVPLESGILLSLNNIGKFLIFDCPKCEEFSHLGLLSVYTRRGKLDIREHLKVYKGERPPEEIASAYVSQHYPEAYVKSYSLPEGFILSDNKFNDLKTRAFKVKEDVSLPLNQLSIAVVFDRVKHAFKDVPSLTMADYEFTDTFFKGINQQQKDHFIKNFGVTTKDLETGCHGVLGIGISGKDIVGLFFQVKATTSNANHKTILDSLAKAMKQVNKDFNVFRVVCGNFLNSIVKLAGFVALPMLSKSKLQKEIKCKECRARILTLEDLDGPGSFTAFLDRRGIVLEKTWDRNPESPVLKTFKEIFDLYVYAASGLDLPRNQTQLLIKSEGQMKKMSEILTPKQRESVMSKEKFMFICGAHGTGKTFMIRERATELAKTGKVLVVNLAGGLLTEEYQRYFKDEEEIQVIDRRDEGLEENIEALKKYLLEKGKNKNILIDEVPITLGFQDIITPEAVTKHWECILDEINNIKSMTVSFRPTDQSYTRDIPLLDVKPRGCQIKILEEVKRNSRKIAELLMAIRCFFSRNVLSLEKTVRMDIDESAGGFLPALLFIPSCSALHPSKCQEKMICEAVRASHAIDSIRNQCSRSSKERPIFVVVDSEKRKNALVNIIMSFFPSIPFLFFSNRRRIWRGNGNLNGSSSLVIVTEHEMMGCYPSNFIIILDFPFTQWKNYNRLIASTVENKILVTEEEELRTGKFSRLTNEIFGWKIKEGNIDGADLSRTLEKAWQAYDSKKIDHLKDDAFSRSRFPGMDIDSDGRDEQKIADVDRMLKSWLSGIFGFPASGKTSRIDILIRNVTVFSGHLILLHCGSDLSWEVYRKRWGNEDHVKLAYLDSSKIKSVDDILDHIVRVKENKAKLNNKKKKMEKEEDKHVVSNETVPLFVVVEDCPLLKDFEGAKERLQKMNTKLILAFRPHSDDTSGIAVEKAARMREGKTDCTAIVIRSQPMNVALVKYIQRHETRTALSLPAMSAAIVPGPPVRFISMKNFKCSQIHSGYICSGNMSCSKYATAALSLSQAALLKAPGISPFILVTDEDLLASLETCKSDPDIVVLHPQNFRGCEASVVVSVNVNEDWLQEAISCARTGLVIIDNIPNHQHLWDTMTQEGRVEAVHDTFPSYTEEHPKVLLRLDEKERFLKGPTWDETAKRVGKEALRCGYLNETTGAIQNIPPETWETLDHSSKTLHSSSPFQDWGYVYNCESPGSVTQADEEERKKILEILLQMRVKWEDEKLPPVPLKMSGEGGVLESLSLSLTGSLLHLSLLQNILVKKNFEEPLTLLQSGADHFHRPIVLIGEKFFRIFIPSDVKQAENEWRGILLFAEDFPNGGILPVVRNSGHVWMKVNTLPKEWKGKMPKTLERISFRGTIDVDWRAHTVPLMWVLDRCMVDLLPLSPGDIAQ